MLEQIQSYKVISLVGTGGMGTVYKAEHILQKKIYAVKALHSHLFVNEDIKKRFKNEAIALSKLNHPNIVSVYDLFEDASGMYIVMEFIEGTSLDKVIKSGGTVKDFDKTADMFKQLVTGIGHAHSKGIIHRDIKPGNVILSNDGIVKLTDFGIAKDSEANVHTSTGVKLGTLQYMSPEQINTGEYDERSDIYSLGVTFYQMITGRLPFTLEEKTTDFKLMEMIIKQDFPDPRKFNLSVPSYLIRLMEKCTSKNPVERFQNTDEILKAVVDFKAEAEAAEEDFAPKTMYIEPKKVIEESEEPKTAVFEERKTEAFITPPPPVTPPPPAVKKKGKGALIFVLLLIIAAGSAAAYYFINSNNKPVQEEGTVVDSTKYLLKNDTLPPVDTNTTVVEKKPEVQTTPVVEQKKTVHKKPTKKTNTKIETGSVKPKATGKTTTNKTNYYKENKTNTNQKKNSELKTLEQLRKKSN